MNNVFNKRIDELGRIVIPKVIRDNLNIKNFDELDIYVSEDNIILKKNIGLTAIKDKIEKFIGYISTLVDYDIFIYDKNSLLLSTLIDSNLFNNSSLEYNSVICFNNLYLYKTNIIIDSNYLGDIVFVRDNSFDKDNNDIRNIKNILLDLIK